MTAEEHARRIAEYFKYLDTGTEAEVLRLIDEFFAEDYVAHMAGATLRGREGLKSHVRSSYATFGDMQHGIQDNFAAGDRVATRVQFRALHKGEFLGIAPTGRLIECPVIYIHRFGGGKIQEAWLDWDSLTVLAAHLRAREDVAGGPTIEPRR